MRACDGSLARVQANPKLEVAPTADGGFGFTVKRVGFEQELFHLQKLVFSDQYISFTTSLPADPTLYGLGEHKTGIKLTNGIRCFVAPASRIVFWQCGEVLMRRTAGASSIFNTDDGASRGGARPHAGRAEDCIASPPAAPRAS